MDPKSLWRRDVKVPYSDQNGIAIKSKLSRPDHQISNGII